MFCVIISLAKESRPISLDLFMFEVLEKLFYIESDDPAVAKLSDQLECLSREMNIAFSALSSGN
jgi:hypothetical protein